LRHGGFIYIYSQPYSSQLNEVISTRYDNSFASCHFNCSDDLSFWISDKQCSGFGNSRQDFTNHFNSSRWLRRGLSPFFIYRSERRERTSEKLEEREKIPVLTFDGLFKSEDNPIVVNGSREVGQTTFFIRVENTNKRSEGRAESCSGFLEVLGTNIKNAPTVWADNEVRYFSFSRYADLRLFTLIERETISFPSAKSERGFAETRKSYTEYVNKDLKVELECVRGRCPTPYTKKIDDIVKQAKLEV
jgi:hypothetical protein